MKAEKLGKKRKKRKKKRKKLIISRTVAVIWKSLGR